MLSKLLSFIRSEKLVEPGDRVICAVSGGADSVALLFALYLLKDKLGIALEAAHFNHNLRGEESRRDEAFVRQLCDRYDIPLSVGSGAVKAGKKGLEAAAREARYAFFATLGGKIATAHTADDNAETVLMHLIRGTGLKGLGGIAPVRGNIIRPMLTVTRQENEAFLSEWCLSHIEDSSNESDAFLRNRLRHHVMPLLRAENPRLAEKLSRTALGLREDEAYLSAQADFETLPPVGVLKDLHPALRSRVLERFLKENGVREPEERHLRRVEALLYSDKPSARTGLPGGVTVARNYDTLTVLGEETLPETAALPCPGEVSFGEFLVRAEPAGELIQSGDAFTVCPAGPMTVGPRKAGDSIRLPGGSKSLKKLYIDRKIPASQRPRLPVVSDGEGVLGVYSIGVSLDRAAKTLPAVTVRFIKKENEGE